MHESLKFTKKGFWVVLLLIPVVILVIASCSQSPQEQVQTATVQKDETDSTQKKTFKIAVAHSGSVADGGWSLVHHDSVMAVKDAFPDIDFEIVEVENFQYSEEASRTLERFVASGANLIIITSEYGDYVTKVAEAHPDVGFIMCTNRTIDPKYNVSSYYDHEFMASYIAGVAAGKLTKTNKLGFIGGFTDTYTAMLVNPFHFGARSVNPNVTTNLVVLNSWFDPAGARHAAESLIDSGVDVISGAMDEGTYITVANERGVWGIGETTDMRRYGPDAYVTSVLHNWEQIYISEVQKILDGTWTPGRLELNPLGGGTDIDKWGEKVPEDVQIIADEVREKMLNEGYYPFIGPIYDSKGNLKVPEGTSLPIADWYTMEWAFEGVLGFD